MTTEQWTWILGGLLTILAFWLRDWKEKIEAALAVKQAKIDSLTQDVTVLKVEMEKRVKREELEALRRDLSGDFERGIDRVMTTLSTMRGEK